MTARGGISLLDLIADLPAGGQALLPAPVRGFLELLAVDDHDQLQTGSHWTHTGTVRGATDQGLDLSGWPLRFPGLSTGVAFSLVSPRTGPPAPGGGGPNVEGSGPRWILDLQVDLVAMKVPGLRAATRVPPAPTAPAHLEADPELDEVWLEAGSILRIVQEATGNPSVTLVGAADPFDDAAPAGKVVQGRLRPSHALVGGTGFGLTVDQITVDASPDATPGDILARGQDAAWTGVSLDELTLYLPRELPIFGDVNVGVRKLLVGTGDTPSIQGAARIELGQPPQAPAGLQLWQDLGDRQRALADPAGTGPVRTVLVDAATGPRARLRATVDSGSATVFVVPGRGEVVGTDTGWFTVELAQPQPLVHIQRHTDDQGRTVDSPPLTLQFARAQAQLAHAPLLRARHPGGAVDGCVHLQGTAAALAGITLTAQQPPDMADPGQWAALQVSLGWTLSSGASATTATGPVYTVPEGLPVGTHSLVLATPDGLRRRVELRVLATGALLLGGAGGVTDASGNPVGVEAVLDSLALGGWHATGGRAPGRSKATVNNDAVNVPVDVLAEVAVALGAPAAPDAPTPPAVTWVQHQRVHYQYDAVHLRGRRAILQATATGGTVFGPAEPWPIAEAAPYTDPATGAAAFQASTDIAAHARALRAWAGALPAGTRFLVIGRTCDIGSRAHNTRLGRDRAHQTARLLLDPALGAGAIAADRLRWRGEDEPTTTWRQGTAKAAAGAALPAGAPWTEGAAFDVDDQAILGRYSALSRWVRDGKKIQDIAARWEHRSADIYALVPPQTPPTPRPDPTPPRTTRRRVLVPGADAPAAAPVAPRDPDLPWRVTLEVRWDSPRVVAPADWAPTFCELRVAWQATPVAVPGATGTVVPQSPPGVPDVWQVVGRFSHDPRSGQTLFSVAVDRPGDPDGLAKFTATDTAGVVLGTALAFGPALLGGISAAAPDSTAVRIAALTAAGTIGAAISDKAEVVLQRVEIEHRQPDLDVVEGFRSRIRCDYGVALHVKADNPLGLRTDKPVRVRYRNVGLTWDDAQTGLEKLSLSYDEADFAIEDPGQWVLDNALGRLLGVTAVRMGAGSVWFELDLEFTLDLGVVEVTEATVRITLARRGDQVDVDVAVRGLAARVDLPGVVRGTGQLALGAQELSAAIDLEILPIDVRANAALSMKQGMTHVEAGVVFGSAIPLASSGLGLSGVQGRFVSNGVRTGQDGPGDPAARLLAWHQRPVGQKYGYEADQNALGLGVVVGTLPDGGFTFHALGMLVVAFPQPAVLLSIDAKMLQKPTAAVTETAGPSGALTGLVEVTPEHVLVAVRGLFEVPNLLRVDVPFSAYFPMPGVPRDAHLRVGADGGDGRPDSPVSLTLLPGVLDVDGWAFFMVEERKLHDLGGPHRPRAAARMDLNGFALGFGAGFKLDWGNAALGFGVSATVLAGVGTRPFTLAGTIHVAGSLRLLIVSIGLSGTIQAIITDEDVFLRARFCGRVSFFFFSVSACVGLTWGGEEPEPPVLPPDPLVDRLALLDGWGRSVAEASEQGVAAPRPVPTVWPDTIPLIHLAHPVVVASHGPGIQLPSGAPRARWVGSSELRHLFRLESVELLDSQGQPIAGGEHLARWNPRPGATAVETAEGDHEGAVLGLFHWRPQHWQAGLADDVVDIPGEVGGTLATLCDTPPVAKAACALGAEGRPVGDQVHFASGPPSSSLHSQIDAVATEALLPMPISEVRALAASAGMRLVAGRVAPVGDSAPPDLPHVHAAGWQLPQLHTDGALVASLDLAVNLVSPLRDLRLTLAVVGQIPAVPSHRMHCVDFSDHSPTSNQVSPLVEDELRFRDRGDHIFFGPGLPPAGGTVLVPTSKGMRIEMPRPARRIRLELSHTDLRPSFSRAVEVVIHGAHDAVLHTRRLELDKDENVVHIIEHQEDDIRWVSIDATDRRVRIHKVCADVAVKDTLGGLAETAGATLAASGWFPRVMAHTTAGRWVQLEARCLAHFAEDSGRFGVYLEYRPDAGDTVTVHDKLIVLRWPLFTVSLLALCGISAGADAAAASVQELHDELEDVFEEAAEAAPGGRQPDPDGLRWLMAANTPHTVRVRWRWLTWVAADANDQPPPVDSVDWSTASGTHQDFRFDTAAAGALSIDDRLRHDAQQAFDPAALLRYLRGFDPTGPLLRHFLDDALLVHFSVLHVEGLLARYGKRLKLRLRRTDPAPGSLVGRAHPPDVAVQVTAGISPDAVLTARETALTVAIRENPCIAADAVPHSTTLRISATLDPGAAYDLIVAAVSPNLPGDEGTIIAVQHFRTSRHRGPEGLLQALGFGLDNDVGTSVPVERIAPAPLPVALTGAAAPPLGDDAALDAALAQLGLDPLPLPRAPRTVLVWSLVADQWAIVGVLLDSDEALLRPPRLEGAGTVPRLDITGGAVGAERLRVLRSNVAGTRVLLAPAAPLVPGGGLALADLVLTIDAVAPDRGFTLRRSIGAIPHIISQELA